MERSVDWIRDELGAEEFFEIEVWRIVEQVRRAVGDEGPLPDNERFGARYRDVEMLLSANEARGILRRGARDVTAPLRPSRPSVTATLRP
jgi:hypothetical protein